METQGDFSLIDIGYEYYITRFTNMDDYHHLVPDKAPTSFFTAWIRIF